MGASKKTFTLLLGLSVILGATVFTYWRVTSNHSETADMPTNEPVKIAQRYDKAVQSGEIFLPTPDGKQPPVRSEPNNEEDEAEAAKYGSGETLVRTEQPEAVLDYARQKGLSVKSVKKIENSKSLITLNEAPSSTKIDDLTVNTPAKASANYRYHVLEHAPPNDPKFSDQWNMQAIDAPKAWHVTTGATDTAIAIIDTGVLFEQTADDPAETFAQPDFPATKRWENSGEIGMTAEGDTCWTGAPADKTTNNCDDDKNGYMDDWQGWDFMGGWNGDAKCPNHDPKYGSKTYFEQDNDPQPYSCDSPHYHEKLNKHHFDGACGKNGACFVGHGTMAASAAAAATNNGNLMAGIDRQGQIMNLRVMDGYGITFTSLVAEAVRYATTEGVDVISLSLGVGECNDPDFVDPVLEDALQAAKSAGVTIVAASGNGGQNNSICYPASSPNAIAVGATSRDDKRASFSDGSDKLDVVAPGQAVPVANAPSKAYPANYYTGGSGTSFSTPHVAGLAGLIEAYAPKTTPNQKYEFITKGADKVAGMNGKNRTNGYGYGRINANNSLQIAIRSGYKWKLANQAVYSDQARTQEIVDHIILAPGEKVYVSVKAKNTGYQTWEKSILKVGTSSPQGRQSKFQDESWLTSNRPARITEEAIKPGETGTFEFVLAAPQETGAYRECFNLVAEGLRWLNGKEVCYQIKVGEPPLDTLYSAWQLLPGQQLLSKNGKARLTLQTDGNLVLHAEGYGATWTSGTTGNNPDRLVMQHDGNLVLYDKNNKTPWHTRTWGSEHPSKLVMQDDGNLVVYRNGDDTWASRTVVSFSSSGGDDSSSTKTTLRKDETLRAGESLENGGHRLVMQTDGNLVVYGANNKALWHTRTWGGALPNRLVMQADGNLVLYDSSSEALWHTRTWGGDLPNRLVMQKDSNLVVYDDKRKAQWHRWAK